MVYAFVSSKTCFALMFAFLMGLVCIIPSAAKECWIYRWAITSQNTDCYQLACRRPWLWLCMRVSVRVCTVGGGRRLISFLWPVLTKCLKWKRWIHQNIHIYLLSQSSTASSLPVGVQLYVGKEWDDREKGNAVFVILVSTVFLSQSF